MLLEIIKEYADEGVVEVCSQALVTGWRAGGVAGVFVGSEYRAEGQTSSTEA